MDQTLVWILLIFHVTNGQGNSTAATDIPLKDDFWPLMQQMTFENKVTIGEIVHLEKGVILTVQADNQNSPVHIRHLGVNPPYDVVSSISVPGLRFSTPDMHFLSVENDFRRKEVYLYDVHFKTVFIGTNYNAPLELTNSGLTFYALHVGVSSGAVQVAYDWLSEMIYWVDSVFKWIVVAPGNFEMLENDYFNILIDYGLDHPEGITVDPIAGYMFISDNGAIPRIERALLDGTERVVLENITGLRTPESLEVDIIDQMLYICDTDAEQIIAVDYNGNGQRLVRRFAYSVMTDIAIYRDSLYATNIQTGALYIMNKTDGSLFLRPIQLNGEKIYGVSVYKAEVQPYNPKATTNCTALDCDQMCISTATGAKCICSVGYVYNTSTNVCDEAEGKFHRGVVIANITHICLADIRSLNFFSVGYGLTCVYTVLPAIVPTTTTTTTTTMKTTLPTTTPSSSANNTSSSATTTKQTTIPTTPTSATPTPTSMSYSAPNEIIVKIDLDMTERLLFIALNDSTIYVRPIDFTINITQREKITTASGKISGLVFDWINTANLYWSESDTGYIYEINTKTFATRRVINTPVPSPRDLNILAHERKLVFSAMQPNGSFSLHTVDLDGQNLANIAVNRENITSLTVDQDARLIYWAEAGAAYSIDFTGGSEPKYVTALNDELADNIIHYKNYLIWTRPNTSDSGTDIEAYILDRQRQGNEGQYDDYTVILDLKILDTKLQQPDPENPCAFRNGDCEQICVSKLVKNTPQKECECSLGFTLQSDGRSCGSDNIEDEFALVTDWTNDRIFQISFADDATYALHFEEQTTYFAVFYHKLQGKVFWSELYSPIIHSSYLNGTGKMEVFDNGQGQVEKFALDETTGNLFYTINVYPTSARIGVLSARGEQRYLELSQTFPQTYFFSGIDVHPQDGLLFFTAGSYYYTSYIVRANMDGSGVELLNIPIQESFSLPEGLAVDHVHNKLYWADYYQDKIYKCNLDGTNCAKVVDKPSADIKDVTTDSEYIYYTAWNAHYLNRVKIENLQDESRPGSNLELGRLESVSVYRSSKPNDQQPNQACQLRDGRGACSIFCLPTTTGYTCACEEGVSLNPDGRSCPGEFLCNKTFNQNNSPDITITVGNNCLRYVGEVCPFTCSRGYGPVNVNSQLTCTSVGWDQQLSQLCEPLFCPDQTVSNGQFTGSSCDRRAGSSCQFTCDAGYRALSTAASCGVDGQWITDLTTVCSNEICIQPITHGETEDGCSLANGAVCNYTCNSGFKRAPNAATQLTCNSDGLWSSDPTALCQAVSCPANITNGQITVNCPRAVNSICTYDCVPGSYKPQGLSSLTCKQDGTWDTKGLIPCSAICTSSQFKCVTSHVCIDNSQVCNRNKDCVDNSDENFQDCSCPSTIPQGTFISPCDYLFESSCDFRCISGFKRRTDQKLTCQRAQKTWSLAQPCEEIICPTTITNGNISATCNRGLNARCTYTCDPTFTINSAVTTIICQTSGAWNQSTNLCLISPTVTSGQKGGKRNTLGIALGVVVAVLVIVALGIAFFMIRRKYASKGEIPSATFSNANINNVAIENPGYMTADLRVANDMDEPYINTNMRDTPFNGISQPTVDHNDIDTGISNPLYFNREPLPADSEISQPTHDTAVLTTDSWQKEKGLGPLDSSNNNQ